MLDRYEPHFTSLSDDQSAYLAEAILRRHETANVDPSDMFNTCAESGLDQADVVLSLAQDATPRGIAVIETLVGKPIQRVAPSQKRTPRSAPRQRVKREDPRVLVSHVPNPKRGASRDRYALYENGLTVTQLVERGITTADIRHDLGKGFIVLGDPS